MATGSQFNGKPYTSGTIGGTNALTKDVALHLPKSNRADALGRLAAAVAKLSVPSGRGSNSSNLFLP